MSRDYTFSGFLKEFGMRLSAAAVVLVIFFGLGYINRTNLFGLSNFLGSQLVFFIVAFSLVGLVSVFWIIFQQNR